jgi:hypothetical protein
MMVPSPPLANVTFPISPAAVLWQMVWPVLLMVPGVNAPRTVTVHIPSDTPGVVLHVPSLA